MYNLASSSWDEEEARAIMEVVTSGNYTMGSRTRRFEDAFSAYVGSRYAVMLNSGSSANLVMIAACQHLALLPRGSKVIVPAIAWSTTYAPLHQYGLQMCMVDVDRSTFNFQLDELLDAVDDQTGAIIAVNLLGNPNDFSFIREKCGNVLLLEDNCESLGARFKGKAAGTFGLAGTFSFYYSHHMTTIEGGMLVTDSRDIYELALCFRAHGWTRDLPGGKAGSFEFVVPGYSLRPTEIEAAVGLVQLKKLPEMIEVYRANALLFKEVISPFPWISTQREIGESSWMLLPMTFSGVGLDRVKEVFDRNGIMYRSVMTGNFTRTRAASFMDIYAMSSLGNANYVEEHTLLVGNHHYIMDREMGVLRNALLEI